MIAKTQCVNIQAQLLKTALDRQWGDKGAQYVVEEFDDETYAVAYDGVTMFLISKSDFFLDFKKLAKGMDLKSSGKSTKYFFAQVKDSVPAVVEKVITENDMWGVDRRIMYLTEADNPKTTVKIQHRYAKRFDGRVKNLRFNITEPTKPVFVSSVYGGLIGFIMPTR